MYVILSVLTGTIAGDWIKARHQLIAQDLTGTFWAQFGDLLNLFPHTRDLERIVKEGFSQSQQQQKIALPEDVALRGLAPLSTLHSQLEFQKCLSPLAVTSAAHCLRRWLS